MKKIFFLIMAFWMSMACQSPASPNFTISLDLLNQSSERTLILKRFVYKENNWSWIKVDSTKSSDNIIKWPRSYNTGFLSILEVYDKNHKLLANSSTFIYSNDELKAELKTNSAFNKNRFIIPKYIITVSGGENELLKKPLLSLHRYKDVETVFKAIRNDEVPIFEDKSLEKEVLQYERGLLDIISQHSGQYYTLYQLMSITPMLSINSLEKAISLLSPSLKNTSETHSIEEYINTSRKLFKGKVLPSFKVRNKQNQLVQSKEILKSKYYFIDFWASGCLPCREQTPDIRQIINNCDTSKFEVVYLSINEEPKNWLIASQLDNVTWPNYIQENVKNKTLIDIFSLKYIPQNILVDDKKTILGHNYSVEELKTELKRLRLSKL